MSQNTVSQLPAETVKLITSTQIVTSVTTAVKELVENSIDAGAKVIQIRLENYGLDVIEVKDDGCGISYDNVQRMFLSGCTSKIRQFQDLDQLQTYGFRGEALSALCKIGKVTLTTKTTLDALAMTYDIDHNGLPLSSKPSHLNKGTMITITGLFSNLPVRRLYLSSKKKISEELKKTEQVVQSLALVHPELGVSLIHNKCPIWKKNSVKGIKQSFMQVAGLKAVSKMDHINKLQNQINIDLIIPKKGLKDLTNVFNNSPNSMYTYVNKRPVNCKSLTQPVQEQIFHHFGDLCSLFKYSVCLVSIEVPPHQLDINLEPNKTKILLKNELQVMKVLDEMLCEYYGNENYICSAIKERSVEDVSDTESEERQPKRMRIDPEPTDKTVGEKRTQEFKDKNKEWDLKIINEDCGVNSNVDKNIFFEKSDSQSICSQINSENCTLTTEKELSDLQALLNDKHYKLVTSTNNKNCETRLIDRDDIQVRRAEKPILQDWPSRPKPPVESQSNGNNIESDLTLIHSTPLEVSNEINNKLVDITESDFSLIQSTPSEILEKTVEEIAKDIESDAVKWSNEIIKAMNADNNSEVSVKEKPDTLLSDCEQFDLSVQSISSQMGKKEMKGFTKFARIMRPKIIEEFPNIQFTQVAGILVKRWRNLTPDEVKYYEKMAEVVDTNRKMYQQEKQNEILKVPEKPSKKPDKKNDDIKCMLEKIKKRTIINRPPRKEVSFKASFADVIKYKRESPEDPPGDIRLLGQLQPSGNWLYIKGNEIGHVKHNGLQELIVFQKMLSNHCVPRKALDKPLAITEDIIGSELWVILLSLESEYDSKFAKHIITSDVVTKNGFLVQIDKNDVVTSLVEIIEVAESIPHYGISELKDALRMYEKHGEIGGLSSWRPTAVVTYLTNEAIRMVQQTQKPPDREEMEDLMNTYHLCLRHLPPVCLHSKQIFESFFRLEQSFISGQGTGSGS